MKMTTLLVIDASGKRTPDAEFIVSRPDRHGSFEMCDRVWKTGKRPLTEFDRTVLIVARAHGQVGRTYLPVSATHTDVRLRLHRAPDATLTGCVTDELGKPISGATIAYKPLGPWLFFPGGHPYSSARESQQRIGPGASPSPMSGRKSLAGLRSARLAGPAPRFL